MSTHEAVRLVLAASAKALIRAQDRGRIFVLNMGEQVLIVDLAKRMIQLAGLRPGVDIAIEFTGCRPGEKLYEERFSPVEAIEHTTDEWLDMAKPRDVDPALLDKAVAQVRAAVEASDAAALTGAIRLIVPELSQPEAFPSTKANTIVLADVRVQYRR